ncbi:MAG TPA: M20 family metallopeptidase [Roseiflexaceae bacterium]|nr:M20 family metallopeptidase [Roseiflexaceae bacterium]
MTADIDRALAHLDAEALVAFLQRLVRTPSVYVPGVPGASEEQAARLVFEQLTAWGWQPLWEEVAPGRPNVIAELRGARGDGPLLLLEGHTDVVTPGDLAAWTRDPFGGEIVGRRLYGRGAADMKGGLAAMLFAARALQLAGAPFAGTLRLLVPCDEEGLMLGVKALAARGHADGAAGAIVCEPEGREVCVAQKGALRLRLLSLGRIAHGAMPDEGVNALAGMARLLGRVLDLEAELRACCGPHPLLGQVHISPTVARAPLRPDPAQMNCLPDTCDAFLDIRTLPSLGHATLIARVREVMAAVSAATPAYHFALEVLDDRPATEIAVDHPLVRALVAAHRQVYGEAPVLGGVPGSTDGTILARDRGVPVVVYGPGDKRIPHQPDEFVDLDEVEHAARVYIVAALRFLNAPPA